MLLHYTKLSIIIVGHDEIWMQFHVTPVTDWGKNCAIIMYNCPTAV